MASLSQILKEEVHKDVETSIGEAVVGSVKTIVNRQGKFSGQLRASNNVGLGAPDLSKVEVANYVENAISGTRSLAVSKAREVVKNIKLGQAIFISNNHDYVLYDEIRPGRLAYTGAGDMFPQALDKAVATK